jgi:hypothetical protein
MTRVALGLKGVPIRIVILSFYDWLNHTMQLFLRKLKIHLIYKKTENQPPPMIDRLLYQWSKIII